MCDEGTLFTAFDVDGGLIDLCLSNTGSATVMDSREGVNVFSDLDSVWLLVAGFLVFLMQFGFTLLEVGAVRAKSVENILFKNLADACLGALVWFLVGWGFAYGVSDSEDVFIGSKDFLADDSKDYVNFFFQWCFAATAATIVSGAVAERVTIQGYFCYTVLITGFVYPVVVYWVWSGAGWLNGGSDLSLNDFAGSGVVHMVGGFSGLMGAWILGPRTGQCQAHSIPFQVFGTLILWFGWYGFNCGSTLAAYEQTATAGRVAVTTTLAAASGGMMSLVIAKFVEGKYSSARMCNGILAGLVAITAGCASVGTGSSIIIGAVGAMFYFAGSKLLDYAGIDDVLDAFPVHGCAGAWGVVAAGIFINKDYLDVEIGAQIGTQFIGVLAIAAWTTIMSGIMFFVIEKTIGLRVSEEDELKGLDYVEHTGATWTWGTMRSLTNQVRKTSLSLSQQAKRNSLEMKKNPVTDEERGGEETV